MVATSAGVAIKLVALLLLHLLAATALQLISGHVITPLGLHGPLHALQRLPLPQAVCGALPAHVQRWRAAARPHECLHPTAPTDNQEEVTTGYESGF